MNTTTAGSNSRVSGSFLSERPVKVFFNQPALTFCGLLLILALPVYMLAAVVDSRTLLDMNIWLKPIKFTIALTVYTFTLSWYSNYLPASWQAHTVFRGFVWVAVTCILLEMLWLTVAASMGEAAHFNQEHAILAVIYPTMGALATILTSLSLVIGVGVLLNRDTPLNDTIKLTLGTGLVLTFILTILTASYMASHENQTHLYFSDNSDIPVDIERLMLMGWARNAGDLRVAHFFSTHAMHFIPLLGWLLAIRLPQISALRIAMTLTVVYSLFVAFTFWQAINGQAFPF